MRYAQDWQDRYARAYPLAVLRYLVAIPERRVPGRVAPRSVAGPSGARARPRGGSRLAALLLVGLAGTARWGGLGPLVVFPERPLALLAVLLCAGLAFLVRELLRAPAAAAPRRAGRPRRPSRRSGPTATTGSGAANVMVGRDDLEAMRWIASPHAARWTSSATTTGPPGCGSPPSPAGPSARPTCRRSTSTSSGTARAAAAAPIPTSPAAPSSWLPPPRDEGAGRAVFRNATVTHPGGRRHDIV